MTDIPMGVTFVAEATVTRPEPKPEDQPKETEE